MAKPGTSAIIIRLLSVIVFLVALTVSYAQAPKLDMVYDNVISIETQRAGTPESKELGAGLVVSEDKGTFRILTALHVVEDGTSISISFPSQSGLTIQAKVLAVGDLLDLALLEAKLPAGVRLRKPFATLSYPADHAVKRAMQVWTVDDELDSVPNSVTRLDLDSDTRKFQYTGNSIGKGYSGGPVLDSHARLVGIHLASRSNRGDYKLSIALKIEAALDFLDSKGFDPGGFNKLVAVTAAAGPDLTGEPLDRIRALGLKYDNDEFSESTRNGVLPAIDAYLDAGMSANAFYGSTDRFVIDLPAFSGTETFPAILKEFLAHRLDFHFVNKHVNSGILAAGGDNWFYGDEPETLQDQLFLTLGTNRAIAISVANGKALLAAGASAQRAWNAAQNCTSGWHCKEMITYLMSIGYKTARTSPAGPTASRKVTVGGEPDKDGRQLYDEKKFYEAKPLLEAAAASGDAKAAALVGTYYAYGLGGSPQDQVQAVQWLLKAAKLGDTSSMLGTGYAYLTGVGAAKTPSEALVWFRNAALAGDAQAMTALGYAYFMGFGVPVDDAQATEWFRKGASAGDVNPEKTLGRVLDSMKPNHRATSIPQVSDYPEFQAWFVYRNAVLKNKGDDYGSVGSDFYLGEQGVAKDVMRAAKYFLLGAQRGDTESMNLMSGMYARGEGVPKDLRQTIFWLRKSAESGNWAAESKLGAAFVRGEGGLPQDDRQAVAWFKKSAEGGCAEGMTNLAIMYHSGRGGLPQDINQALFWYRKAAALGEPTAKETLQRFGSR